MKTVKIVIKNTSGREGRRDFSHILDLGTGSWAALCERFGVNNMKEFVRQPG